MLTVEPPDALVLCVYPGNDFQPTPPAEGFDADGRPLRKYFRKPGWVKHLVAWINLHSKFGFLLQRALLSWDAKSLRPDPRLKNWWTDPQTAAKLEDEPAVRGIGRCFGRSTRSADGAGRSSASWSSAR